MGLTRGTILSETFQMVWSSLLVNVQLKTAGMIDSAAKCELCSVIRFLEAEGYNAAEIHDTMNRVYGENFMRMDLMHRLGSRV
ncbi:hypothetical protein AVEN_255602-1 [Araneus ventricosus]|uniref:Uncharacterized protein n=1 Tax=Araneus ventricosus TaxID=182803 RepID=A0A4Y2QTG1_ARAVE|nr:hypothetical protein AVEN_255602-1 [Araneus ventricosus]